LSNSGIVWDYQYLDLWLENPQSLIPENKMVYVGMRKKRDREDLIAYLLIETQQ
jgi:cytochrome c